MRLTRAFALLLAMALLGAAQAALVHPLKHVDAGTLVHLNVAGQTERSAGGSGSSLACDALAALAVFVGNAIARPPRTLAGHGLPAGTRAEASGAPQLFPYRSQAPPSIL